MLTNERKNRRSISASLVVGLATLLLLANCVASNRKIHADRAASIRTVAIHPIEAPPLIVPSEYQLAMEKADGLAETFGLLGIIIGGVVIAANAEEVGDKALRLEEYTTNLKADGIWQPTQVVAEQIASYLTAQDRYRVEMLQPMTRIFGTDQKGWPDEYGPVRSWYNSSKPAAGSLSAKSDMVIEAGIWSYELAQGVLILTVVLRAIDPHSGEVLGRARAIGLPPAKDFETLLTNDARGFKALFATTSEDLTRQALGRLGL